MPFARLHHTTDQGSSGRKRYAVPSGIASDSGYTHWPSFEPVAFLAQGENFAMVDIAWNIERVGQQPPWRFNTAYNLMRTPDGWRVLLCTAYSEKKLNARPGSNQSFERTCTGKPVLAAHPLVACRRAGSQHGRRGGVFVHVQSYVCKLVHGRSFRVSAPRADSRG